MNVYIVDITTRKNDRDATLGPFSTKEKAIQAIREYFGHWKPGTLDAYKEYGSDINEGRILTEEDSAEMIERELD